MTAEQRWQGELWLADDFCLVAGLTGETQCHAHYPHQLLIARDGEIEARVNGQHLRGPVLAIASGCEHEILTPGQPMLSLFAEPLAFDLESLQTLSENAGYDTEALLQRLHGLARRPLQPRLHKALQRIRQVNDSPLPASRLAAESALSLSQLERLFSGELGVSVRRLVLWQRLRHALQRALSGDNLTTAAATAGFADSAHLSRCMRRHFGIRADHTLRHLHLHVIGQGIA